MQEKIYKGWIKHVNELRLHILTAWNELRISALLIRHFVRVNAKGGHFEHKLSQ